MSEISISEGSENSWGHLKPLESYAAPDKPSDFERLSFDDCFREDMKDFRHAAHAMLYTKIDGQKLFNKFSRRATALMQVRFDGYLGFPGGLIDPEDKDIVTGLNRELKEEAGLEDSMKLVQSDHFQSEMNYKKRLVVHFYVKEVSLVDFGQLEENVLRAPEYGHETLGIIRVPCYMLPDKARGLPVFLTNRFIGQARDELIEGLIHAGIFTRSEMENIVRLSDKFAAL